MFNFIGWVGSFLFAICAVPQAYQSFKTKSSEGINNYFLWFWVVGEVLTLIYILGTTRQLPLIFNYIFNLVCLYIIVYYKLRGRNK